MKTLAELTNVKEPAWPILMEWIAGASNKVEILPVASLQAERCLLEVQVSIHSFLGAVIYETGGLLVDDGWLRILGSGCERMNRSVYNWNKDRSYTDSIAEAPYLFVADDVLGGLFAVNGGYLGSDVGNMYYFAIDMLEWFQMEISYTDFLLFAFEGKLDEFYDGFRWKGWRGEVKNISPDSAYSFVPFLWTKEGKDIEYTDRRVVSISELFEFNLDMKEQINQIQQ